MNIWIYTYPNSTAFSTFRSPTCVSISKKTSIKLWLNLHGIRMLSVRHKRPFTSTAQCGIHTPFTDMRNFYRRFALSTQAIHGKILLNKTTLPFDWHLNRRSHPIFQRTLNVHGLCYTIISYSFGTHAFLIIARVQKDKSKIVIYFSG